MNALIRWDPFKEMKEMQDRIGSLFNLPPFRHGDGKQETMTVAEWSPLVDIVEDDREYDIPDNVRGAIVTNIDPDSASYRKGIRPGDVILEIDRNPVRNGDDAVELSKNLKSSVLLRIWRNGAPATLWWTARGNGNSRSDVAASRKRRSGDSVLRPLRRWRGRRPHETHGKNLWRS